MSKSNYKNLVNFKDWVHQMNYANNYENYKKNQIQKLRKLAQQRLAVENQGEKHDQIKQK